MCNSNSLRLSTSPILSTDFFPLFSHKKDTLFDTNHNGYLHLPQPHSFATVNTQAQTVQLCVCVYTIFFIAPALGGTQAHHNRTNVRSPFSDKFIIPCIVVRLMSLELGYLTVSVMSFLASYNSFSAVFRCCSQ